MADNPSVSTITIGENKFNALSVHFGIGTHHDHIGLPQMGSLRCTISCMADLHDTVNLPYTVVQALFEPANIVTRDKIVDKKIEFWTDDSKKDAICTYSFRDGSATSPRAAAAGVTMF